MQQEVRVMLQLTLDVDATLSKEEIEQRIRDSIVFGFDVDEFDPISLMMTDIIEIREEAEIYGTEEESPEMKAYHDKYKIDRKRQTKLDL